MLDPITILDHVILVIPCPECGTEVHAPFTAVTGDGQELRCLGCDMGFQMKIGGRAMPQVEAAFQRIQSLLLFTSPSLRTLTNSNQFPNLPQNGRSNSLDPGDLLNGEERPVQLPVGYNVSRPHRSDAW